MAADGRPVGCIGIYRRYVRAFSKDEISLVETFADQAVIAIQNVRQFREIEDRTAEIEDALIMSDLGPSTAAAIREKLSTERFEPFARTVDFLRR